MKKIITSIGYSVACSLTLFAMTMQVATADSTNTVLSGLITPPSQEDTTTIDQRMSARRVKVQLSAVDKANIVAKCSLAQTAVNDRRVKDEKAAAIRLQTYNDLVKRLGFLVDNLSAQGTDASQLLNAENYFVASINSYLSDASTYKVAIDDLVDMDCKSDPAGFSATLAEAKADRAKLASDAAVVKGNLPNLQKNLAAARQQVITGKKK